MSALLQRQPWMFRYCSAAFAACYGRFPVFGKLRSSVAVIQRGDQFLLQNRSDARGLGFPGGMAWFWEPERTTLMREVREETSLEIASAELLFRYDSRNPIPAKIAVFTVSATGVPRPSWEGTAEWVSLAEAEQRGLFISHRPIFEYLQSRNPVTSR